MSGGSLGLGWPRSTTALLAVITLTFATATGAWAVRAASPEPGADLGIGLGGQRAGVSAPSVPLADRLAEAGYALPPRVSVYAAEILLGNGGFRLIEHQVGAPAAAGDFWPASSVKVLAALGALELLQSLGFTGAATVETPTLGPITVRELVTEAIRESSNEAYDELVRIAGLDRLNQAFLPDNGYANTVIQRSYSGPDLSWSPPMTITEGDRHVDVPARTSTADYTCPGTGNCSTLPEMADSVMRVVLNDELPPERRLGLAAADLDALATDLLNAEGWIQPGATRALGRRALVYAKPGWVLDRECLDVALIHDLATRSRFLLAVLAPDEPECAVLSDVAENVLRALAR